jgi:transposase
MKKHHVRLNDEQRLYLRQLLKSGQHSARDLTRARILLLCDEGASDEEVVEALQTSYSTVERTRKRFAREGLPVAIADRPRPGARPKLDGPEQARLVAIACSDPPAGRARWTVSLLAGELVRQGIVTAISPETVRQVLQKNGSSPGSRSSGASPR